MKRFNNSQTGFTVIELVVVILILCVLGTVVALTYSGVKAGNRDKQRQADVETLQSQLEVFSATHNNAYPAVAEINTPTWRAENMKDLKDDTIRDPQWLATGSCAKDGKPIFAPGEHCYQYEVSSADGSPCDNMTAICAHYTLTATLENNQTFVKASLN